MQKYLGFTLIIGSTLLLSACGYNPQTAGLPSYQQCATLQRKMLFVDNFRNEKNSAFENEAKRQQLDKRYRTLSCSQVLVKSRHGQPKK